VEGIKNAVEPSAAGLEADSVDVEVCSAATGFGELFAGVAAGVSPINLCHLFSRKSVHTVFALDFGEQLVSFSFCLDDLHICASSRFVGHDGSTRLIQLSDHLAKTVFNINLVHNNLPVGAINAGQSVRFLCGFAHT
jgi:hypothetical protein